MKQPFDFIQLKANAVRNKKAYETLYRHYNGKKIKHLDEDFAQLHLEVFAEIDCLSCGNCCRGLGPRLIPTDIARLAKALNKKEPDFISEFIRRDEDDDLVFKTVQCPFIGDDNYCKVYEYRPKACREYPHTDSYNMAVIKKATIKNCETCPAVYEMMDRLIKRKAQELKTKKK